MSFSVLQLWTKIQNEVDGVRFARDNYLIKKVKKCNLCKSRMNIENDSLCLDKLIWRCKNSKYRTHKSIRDNTFFAHSNLEISTILMICGMWCKDFTVKLASEELNLNKKTIIDWYRFCRDIVFFHYENDLNSQEKNRRRINSWNRRVSYF